jgi:hypothetical protein
MSFQIAEACAIKKTTPHKLLAQAESKWGKPDVYSLTDQELEQLLSGDCSTRLHNERHENNPCLAGDIVLLLDRDAKKLFRASRDKGIWIPYDPYVYA